MQNFNQKVMRKNLTIFIFFSTVILGHSQSLDFIKSRNYDGAPTVIDAFQWLDVNYKKNITKGSISNQCCRMDYSLSGGVFFIDNLPYYVSCWKPFNFKYSEDQNSFSFNISNIGCGGCCSCCVGDVEQTGTVTVLLNNHVSDFQNNSIVIKSWNNGKRGLDFCNYDLGFIVWDNYDLCSGNGIKIFNEISFPLKEMDGNSIVNFNTVLDFIEKKTSSIYKECRDFGACLAGNSDISTNEFETKKMNSIIEGDKVLSYSDSTEEFFITEVIEVTCAYHDHLIDLCFSDDTITCTSDHPFFIKNKGWCSVSPEKTIANYSNYDEVARIEKGDIFLTNHWDGILEKKLTRILQHKSDDSELTYTINKLKRGTTYFVNGILTGTEVIRYQNIWSQIEHIEPFYSGRAAVSSEGKWGFIDEKHNLVIPLMFQSNSMFNDNIGNWNYLSSPRFIGDYCNVTLYKDSLYNVIDKWGRTMLPWCRLIVEIPPPGQLSIIMLSNRKFGVIDNDLRLISNSYFDEVYADFGFDLNEGSRNNMVLPVGSDHIRVKYMNHFGFICNNGSHVIPCIYDSADDFFNGKAKVKLNGNEFYIDESGKILEEEL